MARTTTKEEAFRRFWRTIEWMPIVACQGAQYPDRWRMACSQFRDEEVLFDTLMLNIREELTVNC